MLSQAPTEKITARHWERRAYVYVRQSTLRQVEHNRESQVNQYALVERAVALGWAQEQVSVIASDMGQSGQDSQRQGFRELLAEVSLGRVGIVLAYEASRLARNNADWYALLDLAAMVGTLIADSDGVYDPRSYNDRLLLGLRGMLSEAELHLLRLRLEAGRLRQVERGTYQQRLPTGLTRLPDGRVIKDPDLQVQRTLELVFERFTMLGSVNKVLASLHRDGVCLPRIQHGGLYAGELLWRKPTDAALYEILHNPAYAGAFVYGRRTTDRQLRPGHNVRVKRSRLEDWQTIHHDVYPAYLSWEQFLANQARLTDNAGHFAARARGMPRQGGALLTGVVVCGRCGHQMRVIYRAKERPRYVCKALYKQYRESICLHVDAQTIDEMVTEAFFAAIAPAELDLLEDLMAVEVAQHAEVAQQHAGEVRRAEYEARLAERQYRAVDPDNRFVAAELERCWELGLRALGEAREAEQRFLATPPVTRLDPKLRMQLSDLSAQLPSLWSSGRLDPVHKKELLRSLIRRVILVRPVPDTVDVKVVWVSGAVSALTAHPPIHREVDVSDYERLVDRVLALSSEGHPDQEIARRLTAEGFRSARSRFVPKKLVFRIRHAHAQTSLTQEFRGKERIEGRWTVHGLARVLNVTRNWLYDRLRRGRLPASRHPTTGHYLIEDDSRIIDQLRKEVPVHRQGEMCGQRDGILI